LTRRYYSSQIPEKEGLIKTTEAEKPEDDAPEIPPLGRPLGVPEVPTTKTKTLSEKSADFLNQEKQLEKRRHLCVTPFCFLNAVDGLMRP
jgi:ATPase complex subunit ATP10